MMHSIGLAPDFSGSTAQPVITDQTLRQAERLHVLVAEDNPVNQRLVEALLQISGCSCVIVGDGMAAVRAVQEDTFDLVLMDIRMPEMCGLEATRAIRSLGEDFADLPIIAMTANAEEDEAENCAAAGMTGYLPKPIDRQRFLALLQSHDRQKSPTDA